MKDKDKASQGKKILGVLLSFLLDMKTQRSQKAVRETEKVEK